MFGCSRHSGLRYTPARFRRPCASFRFSLLRLLDLEEPCDPRRPSESITRPHKPIDIVAPSRVPPRRLYQRHACDAYRKLGSPNPRYSTPAPRCRIQPAAPHLEFEICQLSRCRSASLGFTLASLMGPVMSSLPARRTPGSTSVDGHRSSSVREMLSIGQGLHSGPMSRQPGYLLLSVVSARLPA
jgi:hypothetical protein